MCTRGFTDANSTNACFAVASSSCAASRAESNQKQKAIKGESAAGAAVDADDDVMNLPEEEVVRYVYTIYVISDDVHERHPNVDAA